MTCEDGWVGFQTVSAPGLFEDAWLTEGTCHWPLPDGVRAACQEWPTCFVDDREYCTEHGARALAIQLGKAIQYTHEREARAS